MEMRLLFLTVNVPTQLGVTTALMQELTAWVSHLLEVKFRLYKIILSSFICIAGHSVVHTLSVYTLCKCMCTVECGIQFTGFAIQFLVLLVKLTVEYLNQQFLVSQSTHHP